MLTYHIITLKTHTTSKKKPRRFVNTPVFLPSFHQHTYTYTNTQCPLMLEFRPVKIWAKLLCLLSCANTFTLKALVIDGGTGLIARGATKKVWHMSDNAQWKLWLMSSEQTAYGRIPAIVPVRWAGLPVKCNLFTTVRNEVKTKLHQIISKFFCVCWLYSIGLMMKVPYIICCCCWQFCKAKFDSDNYSRHAVTDFWKAETSCSF